MKTEKIFTADQFTATQWNTAQDKADFANHFMAFVKAGFPRSAFTKKFYNRLSQTFGHIAHFNQDGFYCQFFMHDVNKLDFLNQTLSWPCYGDPHFTYSDVERAIQLKIQLEGWLQHYQMLVQRNQEQAERAELARLKAKYE